MILLLFRVIFGLVCHCIFSVENEALFVIHVVKLTSAYTEKFLCFFTQFLLSYKENIVTLLLISIHILPILKVSH